MHTPLPKTPTRLILSELSRTDSYENLPIIHEVEKFLKKKRGYVIKKPKKNDKVIIPFTGGLDSISLAYYLLKNYELEVYPVFPDREGTSSIKYEKQAADFFFNMFHQKFGNRIHRIMFAPSYYPNPAFKDSFYTPVEGVEWINYFFLPRSVLGYVEYAYHLQAMNGTIIRNIFIAYVKSDTRKKQDQTLTSMRLLNQYVSQVTNDFSWQISPLFLEKEFNLYLDKPELISWAISNDIPIHMTRSCIQSTYNNCGKCDVCMLRKQSFSQADVKDKTLYESDISPQEKWINKVKNLFKKY